MWRVAPDFWKETSGGPLTASDGMHDFNVVTVVQWVLCVGSSWHNLPVDLHGQAFAGEFQQFNQILGIAVIRDVAAFAVELNLHGCGD